ncbi:MAG: hypothetical protein P4K83_07600 [Terracidiphilus sp.]|nr:hypothetical protein [Terracidiphilus sp.]
MKDAQVHLRHAGIATPENVYAQETAESVRSAVNATTNEILGVDGGQKEDLKPEFSGLVSNVPNRSSAGIS